MEERPGVAVFAVAPSGLTDALFHLEGRVVDGTVVDLPNTDQSFVFGIVEGRDEVVKLGPQSSLTGRLPSGEPFENSVVNQPSGG
jgi:hypothetical protein